MANLALRLDQSTPLTAEQVDSNFTLLNIELGTKLNASVYTAADILTKLKTVDTNDSGLNASTLKGLDVNTGNVPNAIVARDVNGNFEANEITASFYGSLYGSISGNAATVTNGVYTNESYSNPSWITALAGSKITGNISGQAGSVLNGVYTTGSYIDPSWLTISAAKVGLGNVTNESKTTMFTSPNFTGTPTAPTAPAGTNSTQLATTAYVISNGVPSGCIVMWSGTLALIPTGWRLCDGTNGTPDLRDRFIVGAGSTYNVGDTGGSKDAVIVSHTHTANSISTVNDPGHFHGVANTGTGTTYAYSGTKATTIGSYTDTQTTGITVDTTTTLDSTGTTSTNANLPPYFALCFIMKL
jgi:hypothetical protein